MTLSKAHVARALSVLDQQLRRLAASKKTLQAELERVSLHHHGCALAHENLTELMQSLPAGYDESELSEMPAEAALHEIARSDETGLLYTDDVAEILVRTGHIEENDESSLRRLSGILGASPRFERLAPGLFRLKDVPGEDDEVSDLLTLPPPSTRPSATSPPKGGLPAADDFDDDIPF